MNILLTGGNGFIGKHLKNALSSKYTILAPSSRELNLLNKNQVYDFFKLHDINLIIHSASAGVRIRPTDTYEKVAQPNLIMFNNLAEMVNTKRPMITFGSGAEYDKKLDLLKVKEDFFGKSVPSDPYGYSKYQISQSIKSLDNILNLRIFGVFGLDEDKSRVTSYILNSYINKTPILLNQNVLFDFIWIDDFCRIVDFFILNKTKDKFINVTPTDSIEIFMIANLVNTFNNYHVPVTFKQKGNGKSYTGDNSLLLKNIVDFKFTPYEESLKNFYFSLLKESK